MKSGTTFLNSLLDAHPSIFMSYPEEPSYFVDPSTLKKVWRYMWERGFWRSEENYLNLFNAASNSKIIGEASTNYTKLPLIKGVPEKIYQFNSNARFIYIMRDPIERTISHYWHMVQFHSEHRGILRAIKNVRQYQDVSYYAMQLKPYINKFGLESIFTLTHEELLNDMLPTLEKLYDWLGVDSNFIPEEIHTPKNVTPSIIEKASGLGILHRFRHSEFWASISPYIPNNFRKVGSNLSTKLVKKNIIPKNEIVEFLRPIQIEQTKELSDMLGREFSEWKTLYNDTIEYDFDPSSILNSHL